MLHIGAAWYPEHWPEERWAEDVRLMKELGLTVARVAEFAWSTMEPAEGRFEFDWLVRACDLLHRNGLAIVIGTPTAAPPAWLTSKYPETLAVAEDGRRVQHGNRVHYCVNSEIYHRRSAAVAEAMARALGHLPGVIGWQIDNEFCRVCHCDNCRTAFHDFLRRRYGTLEELNKRWSTAYWSQTYTDWEQIPLPRGGHNPGLLLAHKRFLTESYRRFQKLQIDALRPHIGPEQFITHNYMRWFGGFDHYALAEDLDLASWDCYVKTGRNDPLESGAAHDLVRGYKRRNFWLMETQPACVNWAGVNNHLHRGDMRVLAWQAVAHGADAVLYWQWRPAPNGQEQYHGSLIGADGNPRPHAEEVARIAGEFAAAGPALAATSPPAEAALVNSYEARWSIEWQRHHQDFDYVRHLCHYYRPLARRNIQVDIIPPGADLSSYRLVVLPALIAVPEAAVAALREFVAGGGTLVITVRCGMKGDENELLQSLQPGPLADLAGVKVAEYYALDKPVPVETPDGARLGESRIWAEALAPTAPDVQILARFGKSNGWLDGRAAVTGRRVGRGAVYCVGAYLDDKAQDAFMERMAATAGLQPILAAPAGVEAALRRGDGREVYLLINHGDEARTVEMPKGGRELLTGRMIGAGDRLDLEGNGVAVVMVDGGGRAMPDNAETAAEGGIAPDEDAGMERMEQPQEP